jgi:uncharacterized protein YndB with AHSA1/START domain
MTKKIELEAFYPYPPERVWRAITDSKALATWLMENDFKPVVGHKFQFRAKPQPGWSGIVDCEVLKVDPPKELAMRWRGDEKAPPTTLSYFLTGKNGGTHLKLLHDGFTKEHGFLGPIIMRLGYKRKLAKILLKVIEHLGP